MNIEVIDAAGMHYSRLNDRLRVLANDKPQRSLVIKVKGLCGQRYLAAGFQNYPHKLELEGTIGNDLAAFSDGVDITVWGNCQDGVGNTMNTGKIVVHGSAGDVIGYSQRGGTIYIEGDVGYRAGVHLKGVAQNWPTIVIGGSTGDFLGEYMAGGTIIVLGLGTDGSPVGEWVGSGMHGGEIYIRGEVADFQLGKEVNVQEASQEDLVRLDPFLNEYSRLFDVPKNLLTSKGFLRLTPKGHRPYSKLYA